MEQILIVVKISIVLKLVEIDENEKKRICD